MTSRKDDLFYVGIDLGTTNSVLAWGRLGFKDDDPIVRPEVLPIPQDDLNLTLNALPSVVYMASAKRVILGQGAKVQAGLDPSRVAWHFKRAMGSDIEYSLGARSFRAEELSALILKKLKVVAEKRLHRKIRRAVIGVPASFDSNQRAATIVAAQMAGLETGEDLLLDEPFGALLAFVNAQEGRVPAQQAFDLSRPCKILVFDMGGGTTNASVLEVAPDPDRQGGLTVAPLGLSRYTAFGGLDFDRALADLLRRRFEEKTGRTVASLSEGEWRLAEHRLLAAAEGAKIELCTQIAQIRAGEELLDGQPPSAPVNVLFLDGKHHLTEELDQATFLEVVRPFLAPGGPILGAVDDALAKANCRPEDLDGVLGCGGMSLMPALQDAIEAHVGQPLMAAVDPMLAVAQGAVLQHFAMAEGRGSPVRALPPIMAESIGVRVRGPAYRKVVAAGTALPHRILMDDLLALPRTGQWVQITLYRGDAPQVLQNTPLVSLSIHVPPTLRRDHRPRLVLALDIDRCKTLSASAWLKDSPEARVEVRVDNPFLGPHEVAMRSQGLPDVEGQPEDVSL